MGMHDWLSIDLPEVPAAWRGRDLQTRDFLEITDGGYDEDNHFHVGPDRRLTRHECCPHGEGRACDFTGAAEGCDFGRADSGAGPLFWWRVVFEEGVAVDVRGPYCPDEDGHRMRWEHCLNLLAPSLAGDAGR